MANKSSVLLACHRPAHRILLLVRHHARHHAPRTTHCHAPPRTTRLQPAQPANSKHIRTGPSLRGLQSAPPPSFLCVTPFQSRAGVLVFEELVMMMNFTPVREVVPAKSPAMHNAQSANGRMNKLFSRKPAHAVPIWQAPATSPTGRQHQQRTQSAPYPPPPFHCGVCVIGVI